MQLFEKAAHGCSWQASVQKLMGIEFAINRRPQNLTSAKQIRDDLQLFEGFASGARSVFGASFRCLGGLLSFGHWPIPAWTASHVVRKMTSVNTPFPRNPRSGPLA